MLLAGDLYIQKFEERRQGRVDKYGVAYSKNSTRRVLWDVLAHVLVVLPLEMVRL